VTSPPFGMSNAGNRPVPVISATNSRENRNNNNNNTCHGTAMDDWYLDLVKRKRVATSERRQKQQQRSDADSGSVHGRTDDNACS
jgi:hypothetical protein